MLCRRTLLTLVALASVTSGCRFFKPYDPNAPRSKPAEKPAVQPAAQPAPQAVEAPAERQPSRNRETGPLEDANIAAMVLASNNTDISYARLVPSRAQRTDVREFAARMLTDHTGVNALVTQLLVKLDLTPQDNIASLDMRDESANKRDMMRELSGYAFDSTYIENEVSYHRNFLWSIDNVMLRRARNSDLKDLLTSVRPAVSAHMAHAEQVRANVLSKR